MQKGVGNPAESVHFISLLSSPRQPIFPLLIGQNKVSLPHPVSGEAGQCALFFLVLAKRQGSLTKREGQMGIGRVLVVSAMATLPWIPLSGDSRWDTLDLAKGRRPELGRRVGEQDLHDGLS